MFDWDWTDRELMVIFPYFGNRKHLVRVFLSYLKTDAPDSAWGVLAVDDGWGEDWSDLEDEFKFFRHVQIRDTGSKMRGGGFARNVALKRVKCKNILFKDPECVYTGDFISEAIKAEQKQIIRPAHIYVTNEKGCNKVVAGMPIDSLKYVDVDIVGNSKGVSIRKNFKITGHIPHNEDLGRKSLKVGAHYGYATPRADLIAVGGYDERMLNYGPPEEHTVLRLQRTCSQIKWIDSCSVYHLWHPREGLFVTNDDWRLFSKIYTEDYVNQDTDWGEQHDL